MKWYSVLFSALLLLSCNSQQPNDQSRVTAIDPVAKQLELDMVGTSYSTEDLDHNITQKFAANRRLSWENPLAGSPGGDFYYYASRPNKLTVWIVLTETGESLSVDVFEVSPGRLSLQSEKTANILNKN